jgi:alpha-L-fucosidase
MGGWLTANHEAIYGAGPVKMTPPAGVALTQQVVDGKTAIYASLLTTPPNNRLELPIKADTIAACTILDTGLPLKFAATGDAATAVTLPNSKDLIPVVKIVLKP